MNKPLTNKTYSAAGLGSQILWDISTNKESFEKRNNARYFNVEDVKSAVKGLIDSIEESERLDLLDRVDAENVINDIKRWFPLENAK